MDLHLRKKKETKNKPTLYFGAENEWRGVKKQENEND